MNRNSLTRPRSPATNIPAPADPASLNPARWLSRLVHRKYLELFEPAVAGNYSVRMANEGSGSYFLLGTSNETRAAARAEAIHRAATEKGWDFVHRHYSREFTLSVFWNDNPLLCTYATLISRCQDLPAPASPANGRAGLRVALIEAELEVRRALAAWVEALPGCVAAGAFASLDAKTTKLVRKNADLVLFNRVQVDRPPAEDTASPAPIVSFIPFGIYETSDDIFISHTGVGNGYFLRRTHPKSLLDPILPAWKEGAPDGARIRVHLRRYFESLIEDPRRTERAAERSALTAREEEILLRLSKGYPDKQIAGALNISAWTVHNHMKNIFRKLGVHTRTQAVLKYLQR